MHALLIDIDGVIYQGDAPIAGASDAVAWLSAHGVPHLFVTNTTSRPRDAIVDKLAACDVAASAERILTPPVAASTWLAERGVTTVALFVPAATAAEFADFEQLDAGSQAGAQAVVVGDLGQGWDFATLNRAFRLLMADPQPELIALGMTRYWRAADGLRLDTAPFVMALSHASGAVPVVLGKPAPAFFNAALTLLGSEAEATWMIGDDIRTDVAGAQSAGLKGLLVRTGKFRAEDLDGAVVPDAVLENLAALPVWWAETMGDADED